MTEQEIEQDRNCHYDLQSSIGEERTNAAERFRALGFLVLGTCLHPHNRLRAPAMCNPVRILVV